ncbi:MAG: phosphotriesterase family protein [Thermomicrobiales bacterium]
MIQTVLGPIAPEDFGVCLPHEHAWCDQRLAPRPELFGVTRSSGTYMRLDDFDRMAGELIAYRESGGASLVEVTCDGWGRDLDVLARLSAASGVHIVATAGFYIEPCMPRFVAEWSIDRLADRLTREIENGVGDTGRRCGVLKSAIHRARPEGLELKGLQAVAIAQKRTGVAITSHTTGGRRQEVPGGTVGVQQLEILKAEGVDPRRFIVGHVDERPDIDVLSALADEGCFIQFDVIGKEHWLLDATRADLIRALIDRGYVQHVLLSHDRNRDHEMRYGGSTGYCHMFESFLPRLRERGVTEEEITTMMADNPARAFARA